MSYEDELKARQVRQKQWDAVVAEAIADVEDAVLRPYPGFYQTLTYGATGIDPQHLAIWCFFATNKDLRRAKADGFTKKVQKAMRAALAKHGYPEDISAAFDVSFGSDEDVQEKSGGNYWDHLR